MIHLDYANQKSITFMNDMEDLDNGMQCRCMMFQNI